MNVECIIKMYFSLLENSKEETKLIKEHLYNDLNMLAKVSTWHELICHILLKYLKGHLTMLFIPRRMKS